MCTEIKQMDFSGHFEVLVWNHFCLVLIVLSWNSLFDVIVISKCVGTNLCSQWWIQIYGDGELIDSQHLEG